MHDEKCDNEIFRRNSHERIMKYEVGVESIRTCSVQAQCETIDVIVIKIDD